MNTLLRVCCKGKIACTVQSLLSEFLERLEDRMTRKRAKVHSTGKEPNYSIWIYSVTDLKRLVPDYTTR